MSNPQEHVGDGGAEVSRFHSIRFKATLVTLIVGAILAAVSGFLICQRCEQTKSDELSMLASVTAHRLSKHLVSPMQAANYDLVGPLLEAEMSEHNIARISVIGSDGSTVVSAKERTGSGIADATRLFGGADTFSSAMPVFSGDQKLGDVSVSISKRNLHAEQASLSKLVALILAAFVIALAVATYVAVGFLVIRPLKTLTRHTARIASGDFRQKIDLPADNEIGHLGATLDQLQNNMKVIVSSARQSIAKPV